jgi:uncharacterized protein YndB with AHSA1/START domain
METTMTEKRRAFEMSLDIAASADDVWRALTEAEELVRWFPLEARVTPGPGGSITWSWGEGWDWTTRIDEWEPRRRLRLVDEAVRPFDAEGRQVPEDQAEPARIAVEFTLESHGGKTRVRLVHSGFGRGEAWDNELDSISEGWPVELRSLRHYLERHRGRVRQVGRAFLTTEVSRDTAWTKLLEAFRVSPAEPKAGERYEVTAPTGDRFSGTVDLYAPRQSLVGTVRELDDGWMRLSTWRDATGKTGVWVWLATYTGDAERMRAFGEAAQEALGRLFPTPAATTPPAAIPGSKA